MFAWGSYMAAFMYVGAGYILLIPLVYKRLYMARDQYKLEQDR